MALDIRLREIAGKSAGQYFIVTDSSGVTELTESSNLRLHFINTEKGPINTIVVFNRGDISGFQSIFGKRMRKNERQGNFSIKTCLDSLVGGPIAVINLRVFDDIDTTSVNGLNPNKTIAETKTTKYTNLFNTNGLWSIKAKNITRVLTNEHLLNFGNVGNSPVSFFVTVSTKERVESLTNEGENTLFSTQLDIDDYPALNPNMLVKDTFVDVWCFKNTFDATSSTNKYFGQLFDQFGNVNYNDLESLSLISESGFVRRITGSLIPNLKNEFSESISIDTAVNQYFAETNIIAYINDEILESDNTKIINSDLFEYYDLTDGTLIDTGNYLSHRLQEQSTKFKTVNLDVILDTSLVNLVDANNFVTFTSASDDIFSSSTENNKVYSIYETGVRVGDKIIDSEGLVTTVKSIEIVEEESVVNLDVESELTYTRVILTLNDNIKRGLTANSYTFVSDLLKNGIVSPSNLSSYTVRVEQFTNGSASRQNEILDMMLSPGIVKGIKNFSGIRYIVDCFKSFIEGGYKSQYGQLAINLDNSNRFVRCFINEPFIEDLEDSTNPLFKQSPSSELDLVYLLTGGNPNYSTNFLTKFSTGSEMCFFIGSTLEGNNEVPTTGQMSNLFIQKTYQYDVVANASGYLDGIDGLPINPDDIERGYLEKFKWNPIIKTNKGFTIYGNSTGQKGNTALSQIHNSELLAFIKESLYNLSVDDPFKKGTFNEYLSTEVEIQSFMNDLALSGGIQPNPIVICNASNNTTDVSKQKIKLIHIEYFNIDALDKVVFDLNLK